MISEVSLPLLNLNSCFAMEDPEALAGSMTSVRPEARSSDSQIQICSAVLYLVQFNVLNMLARCPLG